MSGQELKVKKDAAVSALFSLYRAAGDATAAVADLFGHLENCGVDVTEFKDAFGGLQTQDFAPTPISTPGPAPAVYNDKVPEPENTSDKAGDNKVKRKRAPRDPNAPKKPLNAFLKFRNRESKRIVEERKANGLPEISRVELSQVVKENWDNLDEATREKMKDENRSELNAYHDRMVAYKISTGGQESQEQDGDVNFSQTQTQSQPFSQSEPESKLEALAQLSGPDEEGPRKKQKKDKKDDKEKKKKKKDDDEK